MYLKWLLIALAFVLSAGCAHVKQSDIGKVGSQESKEAITKAQETPITQKNLEKSELDAPLLFSLLGGELAGQRGDVNLASAFYVDAAKRSKDPQIAMRAAQIALYNKDFIGAKSAVDILMAGDNLSAQTHRLALVIYLKSNDFDSSLEQIEMLVNLGDIPKRNALLAIGDIVARNATNKLIVQVMDELVLRYPVDAGVYLARSQNLMNIEVFDKAEQDARKAIQLDSSWQVSYVQLARVLEYQGDIPKALEVLRQASEQFKERHLLMRYGQMLAKDEQYVEAQKQFSNVLIKEPDYLEAQFALGLVYLAQEAMSDAQKVFNSLYQSDAFKSKAAFYLGRIKYQQKQHDAAVKWFERVEPGSGYIDARASIAMIKAEVGELSAARSVMQSLRSEYSDKSSRFYLLEAELLIEANQHNVLFDLMNEAVTANPTDMALRYTRSIAATEIDNLETAEQDLLFILAKQPDNVDALNALGYTLASKTFRFEEARDYLTKALKLRPHDGAILDSMGWLNYREGHYEQALLLLEKAYKITPEGEIAAHLGETLWTMGRVKEARKIWDEALKQDASNKYLTEVLKRLQ